MRSRIDQLKKALIEAKSIDEKKIAEKIRSVGFKCKRCARCCRVEHGDNTVTVFPFEIMRISHKTGLNLEEIAIPTPSEDRDTEGNIHTFEWVLKKNGDCVFLKEGLCRIYECRPCICKTYPFYLMDGRLMVSECEGLKDHISDKESHSLAAALKERYIIEIKESISLLERFRGFIPRGTGKVCVHDSNGENWVSSGSSCIFFKMS